MKHREFRKIVVNNKEYDWLYVDDSWCSSTINVFEISYIKHNTRKWKKDIRKRKMMFKYDVSDPNLQITPKKIRNLISYGHFLSKQEERKYKLMKLNEKNSI